MIFNGRKSSDWVVAAHCHRPHTLESPASSSTLARTKLFSTCFCIFLGVVLFTTRVCGLLVATEEVGPDHVVFCICRVYNCLFESKLMLTFIGLSLSVVFVIFFVSNLISVVVTFSPKDAVYLKVFSAVISKFKYECYSN